MKLPFFDTPFGGLGANYLKITFAVLKRRKLFTFISLFGISFTLLVLILITAFLEHMFASDYPKIDADRTLYMERFQESDTKNGGMSSGPLSYSFIKKYAGQLANVQYLGFASGASPINTYINHQKINLDYVYTDANFWRIAEFEFLEGKAYNENEIKNNDFVAVINDNIRDKYFGKGVAAVGKMMEVDNVNYRIIGVVRGCPITLLHTYSDIYMPYTTNKSDYKSGEFRGEFTAMMVANSVADVPRIKSDFQTIISKIPIPKSDNEYFKPDKLYCMADSYMGSFLGNVLNTYNKGEDGDSSKHIFYLLLVGFALLFMSLPAINLVNINISRIMERASEIGIRKAFGASSNTLTVQFIIENVIITLLGGILAIILSWGVIYYLNHSDLIPYLHLSINWTVFFVAILVSLVFGLLSGVYPAWRMSKLQVVEALKEAS